MNPPHQFKRDFSQPEILRTAYLFIRGFMYQAPAQVSHRFSERNLLCICWVDIRCVVYYSLRFWWIRDVGHFKLHTFAKTSKGAFSKSRFAKRGSAKNNLKVPSKTSNKWKASTMLHSLKSIQWSLEISEDIRLLMPGLAFDIRIPVCFESFR